FYQKPSTGFNWIFGIAAGVIMARAKFSFTANIRNPIMNQNFDITKAFIVMTAIASGGVTIIQYLHYQESIMNNTEFYTAATPFCILFVIGSLLCGFGMGMLGSVSSGILKNAVAIDLLYVLTAFFYWIGSIIGSILKDYFSPHIKIREL